MTNPQYGHFKAQDPIPLSDARYKWGPSEIVEEVKELVRSGFNSRTWGFVDVEKQASTQCRRHRTLLEELEKQTTNLLMKGDLIAFGRSKDPFAGYRHIHSDNWQDANIDFDENILAFEAQPESKISNIILFKRTEKTDTNANTRIPHATRKEREKKYLARLETLEASGKISSREEDYEAMNGLCDGRVTHDHIAEMRAKFLTPERREGGRPELGQKNPEEM